MAPRILIVGAGIGGLTLAHALRRRGLSFDIVDRAERWESVGAGLGLWCNALRVLDRLSLHEKIAAAGAPFTGGSVTDARGRVLTRVDYSKTITDQTIGIVFHRADLHGALQAGVDVRMGTTITSHSGGAVTFSDGSSARYDVVVGADGVHSIVRKLVWGEVPVRTAGYTSYRCIVPLAKPLDGVIEMWDCGKRVGLVDIGRGRLYSFATKNIARGEADPVAGRLARFRECFREFEGYEARVLDLLERDEDVIASATEEVVLDTWTRDGVALIGDAAHAMEPNLAQGAAMAIEGAWLLAECIASGSSLDRYERQHRARVKWVQDESRKFGVIGQLSSPIACAIRDRAIRLVPERVALRRLEPLLLGGPG